MGPSQPQMVAGAQTVRGGGGEDRDVGSLRPAPGEAGRGRRPPAATKTASVCTCTGLPERRLGPAAGPDGLCARSRDRAGREGGGQSVPRHPRSTLWPKGRSVPESPGGRQEVPAGGQPRSPAGFWGWGCSLGTGWDGGLGMEAGPRGTLEWAQLLLPGSNSHSVPRRVPGAEAGGLPGAGWAGGRAGGPEPSAGGGPWGRSRRGSHLHTAAVTQDSPVPCAWQGSCPAGPGAWLT